MKLIAAILGLLLMPAMAGAERVSVEVRHYYVADGDLTDEWDRIEKETQETLERREAILKHVPWILRYVIEVLPWSTPAEIQGAGEDRQIDLMTPFQPELVQECIVSPGHRMAQRAWAPRHAARDEEVMHVLVERIGERAVEMDLVMYYTSPRDQTPPGVLACCVWGQVYEHPLAKPFLVSAARSNMGPSDRKGRHDDLDVEIAIVRRVSDRSEDRCFPARYGPGIRVPDPNSEKPEPKAPVATWPRSMVIVPPQEPPGGQEP